MQNRSVNRSTMIFGTMHLVRTILNTAINECVGNNRRGPNFHNIFTVARNSRRNMTQVAFDHVTVYTQAQHFDL
jgi:hypothetical protein